MLTPRDQKVASVLSTLNIPFTEDNELIKELTGDEDEQTLIKVIHPITQLPLYIGWDRWGYVIDGDGSKNAQLDQGTLGQVIDYILNIFNKEYHERTN